MMLHVTELLSATVTGFQVSLATSLEDAERSFHLANIQTFQMFLSKLLGLTSPFSWFGRFGFGGSKASGNADAEVGTGFVMQAPLRYVGLVPKLANDLLGVGFVWGEPSATTKKVDHENEYVFEAFYTLQLTPTIKMQPDVQVIWNPTFNVDAGPATVAQLQLTLAW
jgi:Carbohydrate-selective porin, OprB family